MTPHVSEMKGSTVIREEVPNTRHKTGDFVDSDEAIRAHILIKEFPEKYVEVEDKLGAACDA